MALMLKSIHVRARPKWVLRVQLVVVHIQHPDLQPRLRQRSIMEEEVILELTFCTTVFMFFLTAKSFEAAFDDG